MDADELARAISVAIVFSMWLVLLWGCGGTLVKTLRSVKFTRLKRLKRLKTKYGL